MDVVKRDHRLGVKAMRECDALRSMREASM